MNLPNKLTILRTILIPFFLIFIYTDFWGKGNAYIAVAIFIIASLTDLLDGKIARKYNLVTNFGKFMDPLADKLLVCSALIALVDLGKLAGWIVIVIIAREFIISGFSPGSSRQRYCDRSKLLGKIQDNISDDNDNSSCS